MTHNIYKFHKDPLTLDQIFSIDKGRILDNLNRFHREINDPKRSTRQRLEAKMMKALFERDTATLDRITKLIDKFDKSGLNVIQHSYKETDK